MRFQRGLQVDMTARVLVPLCSVLNQKDWQRTRKRLRKKCHTCWSEQLLYENENTMYCRETRKLCYRKDDDEMRRQK